MDDGGLRRGLTRASAPIVTTAFRLRVSSASQMATCGRLAPGLPETCDVVGAVLVEENCRGCRHGRELGPAFSEARDYTVAEPYRRLGDPSAT